MVNPAWWTSQSPVTEVGPAAGAVDALPSDLSVLRQVSRQLVFHYRAGGDYADNGIAPDRIDEIDTRYADAMFARIDQLGGPPTVASRPPQARIVGCCRDFTVLFVAMARHKGMAARARVGFATYFDPGWFIDHVIAEVWDEGERRWRLVEPEIDDDHVSESSGVSVDPLDVAPDMFLTGPRAWLAARSGVHDAERFVVAPDLQIPDTRGWLYLRHNLIHDLAALNKTEMLLWDQWGLMDAGDPLDPRHIDALDALATLTSGADPIGDDLWEAGDLEQFRVPPIVTSYSPVNEEPLRIDVSRTTGRPR